MPSNGNGPSSPAAAFATRPGLMGSIARFWEKTYAPDYVGFVILLTAWILVVSLIEPFHRLFFISNINIQYPQVLVERVSVPWNIAYAGILPFICLVLWLGISKSSLHKSHVTVLGFFISIFLTTFITDVVKNAVGRPRPDLIDRCKPAAGTPKDQLVTVDICTQTDHHVLHDGWRSFPSGHSSFSFAGLGFLALFFAGQMHIFRPRSDLGRVLLALCPLLGAALIAISRCEDYRHDVYDVTCGSILGFLVAYFSYRRYYPSLYTQKCHEPFPSRETCFEAKFGKLKRDEEASHPTMRGAIAYNNSDDTDSGDDA